MRRGGERARSIVNMGLGLLRGKDIARAGKILEEKWLEVIFRRGVTPILALREEAYDLAKRLGYPSRQAFAGFLDAPYGNIFSSLMRPIPESYDPEAGEEKDFLRDFRTADDIEKAKLALRQLKRVLSAVQGDLEKMDFGTATLFSLAGTLFARWVLEKSAKVSAAPLTREELLAFVKEAFEKKGRRRFLKEEFKKSFADSFFKAGGAEFCLRASVGK